MAIVIEEEKSKLSVNIFRIAGWLAMVIVILAAAYYIFFAAPQLVIIAPPAGFQTITPILQAPLNPSDVLNNPTFQSLKPSSFPLPTPQGPAAVGRGNPFVSP